MAAPGSGTQELSTSTLLYTGQTKQDTDPGATILSPAHSFTHPKGSKVLMVPPLGPEGLLAFLAADLRRAAHHALVRPESRVLKRQCLPTALWCLRRQNLFPRQSCVVALVPASIPMGIVWEFQPRPPDDLPAHAGRVRFPGSCPEDVGNPRCGLPPLPGLLSPPVAFPLHPHSPWGGDWCKSCGQGSGDRECLRGHSPAATMPWVWQGRPLPAYPQLRIAGWLSRQLAG